MLDGLGDPLFLGTAQPTDVECLLHPAGISGTRRSDKRAPNDQRVSSTHREAQALAGRALCWWAARSATRARLAVQSLRRYRGSPPRMGATRLYERGTMPERVACQRLRRGHTDLRTGSGETSSSPTTRSPTPGAGTGCLRKLANRSEERRVGDDGGARGGG